MASKFLLLSLAVGAIAIKFLAEFGCGSFKDLIKQDLSNRNNPPPPNPAEAAAKDSAEEFEEEEEKEKEKKTTDQEVIVEEASSLSVPSGSASCSASLHQRLEEPGVRQRQQQQMKRQRARARTNAAQEKVARAKMARTKADAEVLEVHDWTGLENMNLDEGALWLQTTILKYMTEGIACKAGEHAP